MSQNPIPLTAATPGAPRIRFREFVALIASIMALLALAIDMMLPALPAIGHSLGIASPNQQQWIITAYMFGLAATQLIFGPISDQYGRRGILLWCLAAYVAFSLTAAFAGSFAALIAARFGQGAAASGARVLAVAIVRDRYAGARMAKVMSLAFVIFLGVPILAPSIGQLILRLTGWPAIFFLLAGAGSMIAVWSMLRLEETLHPEYREPVSWGHLLRAWTQVLTNPTSIGYTLAGTFMSGALVGFLSSVQQIYSDLFHAPDRFPAVFAALAGAMAVTSVLNSRVVERLGMRTISHWSLTLFVLIAAAHVVFAASGHETEWSFVLFQSALMACFPLAGANFNSLAMEPMGAIAGAAASMQGFISSLGGAMIGVVIGQSYRGNSVPLAVGFLGAGLAAGIVVYLVERRRPAAR